MAITSNGSDSSVVPLIIGGKDVQTTTTFDVVSPVSGNVVHQSSSASVDDANRAAEAAQAAFKVWSKMNPTVRRDLLLKAASIMESRKSSSDTRLKRRVPPGCLPSSPFFWAWAF